MTKLEFMAAQGRAPSYDASGNVRGFRSRPGAPLAEPKEGLDMGSNATSASSWVNTFRNTGPAVQRQAMTDRMTAGIQGPKLFSGISQGIINEFMPQTPIAQSPSATSVGMGASATGMLANPWSAPFGAAMMGGFQSPTATATPTPTPAFDPDMANMMRDWLRSKVPPLSQWQLPNAARQTSFPSTVERSIPNLKPGDYAYATFPNTSRGRSAQSWSRAFTNNG